MIYGATVLDATLHGQDPAEYFYQYPAYSTPKNEISMFSGSNEEPSRRCHVETAPGFTLAWFATMAFGGAHRAIHTDAFYFEDL